MYDYYMKFLRRHGQVVRQGIANPSSPVQIRVPPESWGCGGMVDTTDLKSVDFFGREGSSPSTPIVYLMTVLRNSVFTFDSRTKEIFPVLAISEIPNGLRICSIAIILPGSPVTSIIKEFSAKSTTLALKI